MIKQSHYIITMIIEEALDSAIAEISNVNDKTITLHHYNDY